LDLKGFLYIYLLKKKEQEIGLVVIKMEKTSVEASDDGGDKDPPRKDLEKSHIVYTSVKRKIKYNNNGVEHT
jgi:hypothetical protein